VGRNPFSDAESANWNGAPNQAPNCLKMIASQDSLPKTIEVIAQERGLFCVLRFLLIMFPQGEDLFGDPMVNICVTVSGIFLYEFLRVIREGL